MISSEQIGFIISLTLILAVFLMFYVFIKSKSKKLSTSDIEFVEKNWEKILKESQTNGKQAILDADKLLDFILNKKRYTGTLGEKLKESAKLFSDLNGIWNAHKLRNRIAHELDYHPDLKQTNSALTQFKRAYRDLGVKL